MQKSSQIPKDQSASNEPAAYTDRGTFGGPLFLVGMPRSGTKLLRALLNRHPAVSIMTNETEFLPYLVARWKSFGDLEDPSLFRKFYDTAVSFPYMMSRRAHGNLISRDDWYGSCESYDAAGVFEALMRHDTGVPRSSGRIWGDKSPGYIRKIPMLKALYPDSKIIHIVRDVRDHCASIRKAWSKNVYRAAQRWNDDVSEARKCGRSTDRYLELHYEELLQEPEETLRRLCNFIGIDYVPEMTSLEKPSENIGDTKDQARIVTSNFKKYTNRLSKKEISLIEAITSQTLLDLGYEADPATRPMRVPMWKMGVYRAMDAYNLLRHGVRRLGFTHALRKYLKAFAISPNRID